MIAAQVIQMRVQKMPLSNEEKSYIADRLNMITTQISRATNLVEDFRAFAHPLEVETEQTELNQSVNRIQGLTSQQMMSRGIEFQVNSNASSMFTSMRPGEVHSILILCLAYARETVRLIADRLKKENLPFTKMIVIELNHKDSNCVAEISWERKPDPSICLPDDSKEWSGFKLALEVLRGAGGDILKEDDSISIEFPSI
jgi:nitrogen fixation/metabolism regulation signal transduction histidine kinase